MQAMKNTFQPIQTDHPSHRLSLDAICVPGSFSLRDLRRLLSQKHLGGWFLQCARANNLYEPILRVRH